MTVRRAYSRHGVNALKARVKIRGLQAIDKRTVAAQALIAWRSELLTDLGGEEIVSAQQLALVEMVTRTRLCVDSLDAWLMEQESLVNRKRKVVLPVLRERQQLVDSLARILGQLGLEQKARPVPALSEYLAGKYSSNGEPAGPEPESKAGYERNEIDGKSPEAVKGGVKPDHWGGVGVDQDLMVKEFDWIGRGLERRPAPPACRGAFRPERKAPQPIAATCGAGKEGNYIRRAGFWGRFRLLSLSR